MTSLFWILVGYCALERLLEIVVSKRNQAVMRSEGFTESETESGMSAMVAMHVAWFLALFVETALFASDISVVIRVSAAAMFIAAQGLRWWTLTTLGAFWNVSVLTNSKGGKGFVESGPYRFIRHPNYLVVILELVTLPIAGGAPVTALVFTGLNALLLSRRIGLEEHSLFAVPGYREAMGHKPRFFPFPRPEGPV